MKIKILLLISLLMFIGGCDDDATTAPVDCTTVMIAATDAGTAWSEDMMDGDLCNAALTAYQAVIDGGCDDADGSWATTVASTTEACAALSEVESTPGTGDDEGPPECLLDCEGISQVDPEEGMTEFCEFVVGGGLSTNNCASDCDSDTLEEIADFTAVCTACLGTQNCEEFDDDTSDDDEGSGPPICMQDCVGMDDVEGDSIQAICGWMVSLGGVSNECFSDCDEQDMEFPMILEGLCECFNLGAEGCDGNENCELYGPDDECMPLGWDDGEGDDEPGGEGGPPECLLDCEGINQVEPGDREFCEFVVGGGLSANNCASDCPSDVHAEISDFTEVCTECLANDNCEDYQKMRIIVKQLVEKGIVLVIANNLFSQLHLVLK